MTSSFDGQFALNMLRRLIVFLLLTFGGWNTTAEPTHRKFLRRTVRSSIDCATNGVNNASETSPCDPNILELKSNHTNSVDSADNARKSRKLGDDFDVEKHNDESDGRGKKGKGYGRIGIMLIGAGKAMMMYFLIHAVAALAGKALIVAKVALAIATAVALKKSSEHGEKTAYEIVKHPHHSYIQTHSTSVDYDHHGGFGEGSRRRRKRR